MSRVALIEQLYAEKRKSALEFDYDALWAPPIMSIFTREDINELYRIATSLRYNANIEKKYELIDSIMKARGFKRAHCGTNRVVYNFLDMPTFVAKVAIDRVGMKDSPAEWRNQKYFKPFCCKIFEVDPSGVIAFVERVNPITSLEEFLSVSDDIFNMMLTKIIGKYVIDDLGTEKFMNYGLRYNANGTAFGPVIIDFPYAYELDGRKLVCNRPLETPFGVFPCGGEIDYDEGLNHLVCTKCKKRYEAMDLQKDNSNVLVMYGDNEGGYYLMRTRIVRANGEVVLDPGMSSGSHITKEQYENLPTFNEERREVVRVTKNKRVRYEDQKTFKRDYYSSLQAEQYNKMVQAQPFNPVIPEKVTSAVAVKSNVSAEEVTVDDMSSYRVVKVKSEHTDNENLDNDIYNEEEIEEKNEESVSSDPLTDTSSDPLVEDEESISESEVNNDDSSESNDAEEKITNFEMTFSKEGKSPPASTSSFDRSGYTHWQAPTNTDTQTKPSADPDIQAQANAYNQHKEDVRKRREQKFFKKKERTEENDKVTNFDDMKDY